MTVTVDLEQLARGACRELDSAPAVEILRWAVQTFGARFAVASSMQDAVLVHLVSQVAMGVDVLFLDTGYHFAETLGTRDAVAASYDVNVISLTPRQTVAEQDATEGRKAARPRPGPMLPDAQSGTTGSRAGALRRLGYRAAPGRGAEQARHAGGGLRRRPGQGEDRSDRGVERC